jgi:hypothetical protein
MSTNTTESTTECSNHEKSKKIKKVKRLIFRDNLEEYEGEVEEEEILDGWGIYRYKNGDIYEGKFKNGAREGKGEYIFADGSHYRGDWSNDKKQGYGTYKTNKMELDGLWENDNFIEGLMFKINEFELNANFEATFGEKDEENKTDETTKDCEDVVVREVDNLHPLLKYFNELSECHNNNPDEIHEDLLSRLVYLQNYIKRLDIHVKKITFKDLPDYFVNKFLSTKTTPDYNKHLPNCLSATNANDEIQLGCLCESVQKYITR